MLDGVMLLWFILTALSVLCVVIDIRSTPESTNEEYFHRSMGDTFVSIDEAVIADERVAQGSRSPQEAWISKLATSRHSRLGEGGFNRRKVADPRPDTATRNDSLVQREIFTEREQPHLLVAT